MTLAPPPIPDGFLARWCETLSDGSESPPGAFLPTGLALLSAIAGPRMVMRWSTTHEERMNLWVLNVGMSALGHKTSGISGLRAAVRWVSDDGDLVRLLSVARISDAGLVSSLDVVSHDTAAAVKDAEDYPTGPKSAKPEVAPVHRAVPLSWIALFNEVSPIWMEDGPGWAMDAQRALLAIYDGQLSSTTKATHVPEQECCVTAIGNIPPRVLRDQTTLGMLGSGFVGRWLVVPTPPLVDVVSFPMPNGSDPLNRVRSEVEHMMRVATAERRTVVNGLWAPDARALRDDWYRGWRARLSGLSADDAIGVASAELWGRLQATAVKVATLLALGRQASQIDSLAELRVTCDDVEWASRVVDVSIDYMTETLSESGAESSSASGKVEGRVLAHLERAGAVSRSTARSVTQVADATKGGKVSRGDVVRAIDALMSSGHVEFGEGQITKGAKPTRLVWLGEG